MGGALAGAATPEPAASRSMRSTKPSSAYRATASLLSPPTPGRWSRGMWTSGFASPSTLLSTAWSAEQAGGDLGNGPHRRFSKPGHLVLIALKHLALLAISCPAV